MDSSKANLVLEKFDKKLGFGQTPPCLVQKTKFFLFFSLGSPYPIFQKKYNYGETSKKQDFVLSSEPTHPPQKI